MPELWELCNAKSKAVLGYLYQQENGHYPEWDVRSKKSYRHKAKDCYDPDLEPAPDPELVRLMEQPPRAEGTGGY